MEKDDLYKYNKKGSYEKVQSNSLVKKFSKYFIVIVGLVASLIAIYVFIYEKKSNLEYQVLSNINVLDLKEDLGKLDILYDSTSLKSTKSNLKIYTIRLINNGDKEVLIEFFDKRAPLGIKVHFGKVVEKPEIINSSSKYLKDYFQINLIDEQRLEFNQIIFEPKEFLTIKFLVLHNIEETPKLVPYGKVAGQRKIVLYENEELNNEEGFVNRVFKGNIWVQFVRGVLFLIFWISVLIIVAYLIKKLKEFSQEQKRKRKVNEFKSEINYELNDMHNIVFDNYINKGESYINEYRKIINNENISIKSVEGNFSEVFGTHYIHNSHLLANMISEGYYYKDEDTLIPNKSLIKILIKFHDFLIQNNSSIDVDINNFNKKEEDEF